MCVALEYTTGQLQLECWLIYNFYFYSISLRRHPFIGNLGEEGYFAEVGNFFLFSTHTQFLKISLYLHENWLTYQMDSADHKYEVRNCVKCHDVASLLPWQRCRRYVMTY